MMAATADLFVFDEQTTELTTADLFVFKNQAKELTTADLFAFDEQATELTTTDVCVFEKEITVPVSCFSSKPKNSQLQTWLSSTSKQTTADLSVCQPYPLQ